MNDVTPTAHCPSDDCTGCGTVVDILIAVQLFLEMLGDSTDDASAIDLVSNHIEEVEHLVGCALRQLQGPVNQSGSA